MRKDDAERARAMMMANQYREVRGWTFFFVGLLCWGFCACGARQGSNAHDSEAHGPLYTDPDDLFAITDAPVRGNPNALVTIVEYTDYQCPYCRRAEGVVNQILAQWPNEVRVVVRDAPLAFHPQAVAAARAAYAAGLQQKYWEYHDALFAQQAMLQDVLYLQLASMLGLDTTQFEKDRRSEESLVAVQREAPYELDGVPTFFVNGARVRGAVPLSAFVGPIEDEIAAMHALVDGGVSREQALAQRITYHREKEIADAQRARAEAQREEREQHDIVQLPLDENVPVRGPQDARVTIVVYVDYQCPFCARFDQTLENLMEDQEFAQNVKVAVRMFPLAFHRDAELAAEAALEAHAQGYFWPFQEKLWAAPPRIELENLTEYATAVGLDVTRFRDALKKGTHAQRVRDEMVEGQLVGVRGTPTWFVNGRRYTGALSESQVRSIVRDALESAE